MFAVGVNGDYGAGPLSQPVTVFTHFNQQAAPKKVKVTPTDNLNSIIISWSASCPNIDEPIRYTVIKEFLNFCIIIYIFQIKKEYLLFFNISLIYLYFSLFKITIIFSRLL